VNAILREVPDESKAFLLGPSGVRPIADEIAPRWTSSRPELFAFACKHPDPRVQASCGDLLEAVDALVSTTVSVSRMRFVGDDGVDGLRAVLDALRSDPDEVRPKLDPADRGGWRIGSHEEWAASWREIQPLRHTVALGIDLLKRAAHDSATTVGR
jgi:hypothetical protein